MTAKKVKGRGTRTDPQRLHLVDLDAWKTGADNVEL
jgi:hypothetical protein